MYVMVIFFFKQKTAYEMRISDWSSDVCSSDLQFGLRAFLNRAKAAKRGETHCRHQREQQQRNERRGRGQPRVGRSERVSLRRHHSAKILPGLSKFCGSSARLIIRICSTASPTSATSTSCLPMPMPCSPVHLPSIPRPPPTLPALTAPTSPLDRNSAV